MGAVYSAKVEGIDELLKVMAGIGTTAHVRKVMLKAIVAGAKPLRAAIRSEAPVGAASDPGRGNIKKSVRYKASKKSTGTIGYMIGPFGQDSQHRHLVIYGHTITGHKPDKVKGARTQPNNFVERGENKSRAAAFDAVAAEAKAALGELGRP
jgi:hypothetical protein